MKKQLIFIVAICSIFITGCNLKRTSNEDKQDQKIEFNSNFNDEEYIWEDFIFQRK